MVTRLYRYKLPIQARQWQTRQGLILQTENGFGEIAPLPGFSKETLAEATAEILDVLRFKKKPTLPSVKFGLACAEKSLQSVHLPLAALTPKHSFPVLKLKLGHLSVTDAVELVRKHCKKYRLRLDCNRKWTLDQALEFATYFESTDFDYMEEPVETMEELIIFSEATHFPIALDESIDCIWEKIPSLKAIVVKPTVIGHIPKVPPHLKLVLSSSYESGIGLLHIARLAQELNTTEHVGLDTYTALKDDLLTTPIRCESGFFFWENSATPIQLAKLCPIAL